MLEFRSRLGAGVVVSFRAVILLASSLLIVSGDAARAGVVTWGSGFPTVVGAPTTLSLGGGSTVQLVVTTGGTQGLTPVDLDASGSTETGLGYSHLTALVIFNGGGSSNVVTTLVFSNFVPGPGHERGYLMVGAVDELSTPVVAASSVSGAVQTWTVVGESFDISPTDADPITWNAASGELSTSTIDNAIDSDGIVLDVGSLAQYGTITLNVSQHLQDGIYFSIGEESAPEVPTSSSGRPVILSALLILVGAVFAKASLRRLASQE